jgi:apoptosis-inducing factor 2
VRGTVTNITANKVHLASGQSIQYAYLAIATGSSQPVPAKVLATELEEACAELRTVQEKIQAAGRIAIIGGGAVGIEIASDIKSLFPSKDVTVYHS